MKLLLSQDTKIQITEDVVLAIIAKFDKDVIQLLLSQDKEISITEEIVIAAAENKENSKEIIKLLLN